MRASSLRILIVFSLCVLAPAIPSHAADWPQWRGPNRDSKIAGFTAPATWPKELSQKWKAAVGVGEASPALVGGKVYVFARQGGDEVTTCLDADSGKEIWNDKYAAVEVTGPAGQHPGTRSSPAVAEGKVCTLGVGGVVSCLDAAGGKVAWRKDTKAWPNFFTSFSPIVVEGKCIVHTGGRGTGSIVAYDLGSGSEKWKWDGEGPAYGSPVLMTIGGKKSVVTLTEKSMVGIGVSDGKLLWQTPFSAGRYNTGTPIVDGSTIICAGRSIKIEKEGGGFVAKEGWKGDPPNNFNTPVLKDGLLYGLSPRRNFFCVNAQTGETVWTDMTPRGECGAVLDAGSVMLALTSDMNLVAFKPGKEYSELANIKVAETPTWAYPIVDGKRLFVKDRDSLTLWTLP